MQIVTFAALGLATGSLFGLLALGLVVIYRGSGIVNFAQGAMAMVGAYAYYEFSERLGWPTGAGAIASVAVCGVMGALIQSVVLRSMTRSSALSRVIATLGFVLILQSAAFLVFGRDPLTVQSVFPTRTVSLFSGRLLIGQNQIYMFVICTVLGILLFALYRYTSFGRVTAAVAEHDLVASSLGYSPNLVAMTNWALGSMLAGLAGVLIAPITSLDPTTLVLLVVPAMAVALIGGFSSFILTFLAALALGIADSELTRYVTQPGWGTAAPFIAVILVLIVRGRSLPLRSFVLDRLPAVGSGRVRWLFFALFSAVLCWVSLISDPNWSVAIATTGSMAIICLSVVVLTGYAGQLSLAQFVLAGIGALLVGHLAPHMPFVVAVVVGAAITGVIGGLVGLPALRSRGITLAVATLCFGGALVAVVLSNDNYNGSTTGTGGLNVPTPTVFGWSVDPLTLGNRYALTVVCALLLLSVAVANLRRGVTGRQMLAIRSNERAAAALGINVALVKTYAFIVAASIAAVGGALLAFMGPAVVVTNFDSFTGIVIVAVVVVGGVGNIPGAYIGALLIGGGVLTQLLSGVSPNIDEYLPLVGGVLLIVNLMFSPDGLFEMNRRSTLRLLRPLAQRFAVGRSRPRKAHVVLSDFSGAIRVERRGLSVSDVSVSFGGVHALRDVSIEMHPGEIHGVIGPNGAGKTTLIDAITGFVRTSKGEVRLGDSVISSWSPQRRAASGLSRSFQSLELFTDLTIAENLAVAGNTSSWHRYLTDFVRPGKIVLGPAASEALRQFELDGLIDQVPSDISFGRRKTVAIARSIANSPSVLLLDEPAAGLDDREAEELAALIRRLADDWGIAVLLVEHNVEMIMSISDRVTVIASGEILASGSPDHIRSNQSVIDAYLGIAHQEAVVST